MMLKLRDVYLDFGDSFTKASGVFFIIFGYGFIVRFFRLPRKRAAPPGRLRVQSPHPFNVESGRNLACGGRIFSPLIE